MNDKIIISSIIATMLSSASLCAFDVKNPWSSVTKAKESIQTAIVGTATNSTVMHPRSGLTVVSTESVEVEDSDPLSSLSSAVLSGKEGVTSTAKTATAMMDGTTRIYGSGTKLSTAKPSSSTISNIITIKVASPSKASGVSKSPSVSTKPKYGVPATCGASNFDDVVKNMYGSVSLTRKYTDAKGKSCILGKMKKYVKVIPYSAWINTNNRTYYNFSRGRVYFWNSSDETIWHNSAKSYSYLILNGAYAGRFNVYYTFIPKKVIPLSGTNIRYTY